MTVDKGKWCVALLVVGTPTCYATVGKLRFGCWDAALLVICCWMLEIKSWIALCKARPVRARMGEMGNKQAINI